MPAKTKKLDPGSSSGIIENENHCRKMLKGLRVLVVEDVGMVAMALKTFLEDLGCVVVATTARLDTTSEVVRREPLDGVLLDLNLGGQYSFPIAEILLQRKVPFIFMSGYDAGQLRPDLADVPQMQKPFERAALEAMILTEFCNLDRKPDKKAGPESPRSPESTPRDVAIAPLKTLGEMEAEVCQGMSRFEQEYIGRGPKDVHAHLIGELLVVRLFGVLTAAEKHLVETSSAEQGRDLLKQVRSLLIETARLQIESMIQVITGVNVVCMHHDISTVTGEEVVVFSLNKPPVCRVVKNGSR